jgi:hypothetical protein
VLPRLHDQFDDDPERFRLALFGCAARFDAGAGLLGCERAKAEQVLFDLAGIMSADAGPADALDQRYASERRAELLLHDQRARSVVERRMDDAARIAKDLTRQHNVTLRARSQITQRATGIKLDKVASALESSDRCLVHVIYESGHFSVFWLRSVDGIAVTGRIDVSKLDSEGLVTTMAAWWSGRTIEIRQEALKTALDVTGRGFALALVEALRPAGVTHLVISPTTLLDLLPIHCAPVSESELLIDVFENISYAPSASVLNGLRALGPVSSSRYVAIPGEDPAPLPNAIPEIEAFCRMFPVVDHRPGSVTPGEALALCRDANVIHFACHADWFPNDYYASGLKLKGETLTCARILADGDFRRAGLVTLAGCATGASIGSIDGVRGYAGMDSAFLARGARSTLGAQWEIDDLASLLFHHAFYTALRSGDSVQAAYAAAVRFLRNGEYLPERMSSAFSAAIEEVQPDWRVQLARREHSFQDVYFWGAFRCSGWTWGGLRPFGRSQ